MTRPQVSIVVATHQRSHLLNELTEALLGQQGVDHEVIVVNDGSTDDTRAELERLREAAGRGRLRLLHQSDNRGAAAARNRGWRAAQAPLVAFTDDDCLPGGGWAAALVAASVEADVVQGRTLPRPDRHPRTYWSRSLTIERWTGRFETCNLLVRRELLDEVGGFDERFPVAMGEDTELGYRLLDAGARPAYAADALVHHEVWERGFLDYLRERRRWAVIVQLVAIEPRARDGLAHHWVWRYSHVAILAAVPLGLAALATGWWWLPPVAALGWVVRHALRPRTRDGRSILELLGRGVQELVAVTWETLCFTTASIRYRTILL